MLDLAPDFNEFFGSLIEHGVELIKNKRAAGRTKDLADIEDLEQQA